MSDWQTGALAACADQLSAKDAEIARLREALKPFSAEAERWGDRAPDDLTVSVHSVDAEHFGDQSEFTVGDLRRARAALSGQ